MYQLNKTAIISTNVAESVLAVAEYELLSETIASELELEVSELSELALEVLELELEVSELADLELAVLVIAELVLGTEK